MIFVKFAMVFLTGYLLGSISFAIVVSKVFYKQDIRNFGSGNAGMTNVLRTFGKKAAAATFAGDFLKGSFSVMFARFFMKSSLIAPVPADKLALYVDIAIYVAIGGALLGHLKPLYFGFKGGKGISVAFGSVVAATPLTSAIAFAIWGTVMLTSRMVSLASIVSVIGYTVATLIISYITNVYSVPNIVAAFVFSTVIIYAHRSNIKRLINGTEYKFGQKK